MKIPFQVLNWFLVEHPLGIVNSAHLYSAAVFPLGIISRVNGLRRGGVASSDLLEKCFDIKSHIFLYNTFMKSSSKSETIY